MDIKERVKIFSLQLSLKSKYKNKKFLFSFVTQLYSKCEHADAQDGEDIYTNHFTYNLSKN